MRIKGREAEHKIKARLGALLLVAVTSIATFVAPSPAAAWDGGTFSTSSASALVTLTNRSRASSGLRTLRVDSTLSSVARWRSKDMITRDYFSHTIPGYGKVWDKLHAIAYCYKVAGENIGWNNYPDDIATAAIHKMFMGSPSHRSNILGKAWDVIGIGAYKGSTGKKMWTVIFADKCGTTAATETDPAVDSEADGQARADAQVDRQTEAPRDPSTGGERVPPVGVVGEVHRLRRRGDLAGA